MLKRVPVEQFLSHLSEESPAWSGGFRVGDDAGHSCFVRDVCLTGIGPVFKADRVGVEAKQKAVCRIALLQT
jgi:hypothetical protein